MIDYGLAWYLAIGVAGLLGEVENLESILHQVQLLV